MGVVVKWCGGVVVWVGVVCGVWCGVRCVVSCSGVCVRTRACVAVVEVVVVVVVGVIGKLGTAPSSRRAGTTARTCEYVHVRMRVHVRVGASSASTGHVTMSREQ